MSEFVIKKFDPRKLKDDSTIVILGKRRSGKSFLIKDLLYHKRHFSAGVVISNTDHVADPPFFQQFIPRILIHKEYSSKILKDIFARQEKSKMENWKDRNLFLVMDDCISDANVWKKDRSIKEIFFNGRHHKIFYMLTTQDPMAIPPGLRGNIDYIFIHKTNNMKVIQQLYDNYAGFFDSLKTFKHFLGKCTEDHKVLVIDNVSTSTDLSENIYFYKAEPHEDFRMLPQEIWNKSEEIYNRENTRKSSGNTMVVRK